MRRFRLSRLFRLKLGAIVGVFLLAALSATAFVVHNAHADASVTTFRTTFDLTGEQIGDGTGGQCVAETITISQGTTTVHGSSVLTGSGNFNATFDVESHAIGIGDVTGTQYEIMGAHTLTFNAGPGQVFEEVDNDRIVGPGPDNGTALLDRNHLTANANGEITVIHNSFSFGCA
jgi:hypothetical protein